MSAPNFLQIFISGNVVISAMGPKIKTGFFMFCQENFMVKYYSISITQTKPKIKKGD